MIKCNNCHGDVNKIFPTFTFTINGFDMELHPDDYALKQYGTCILLV